MVIRVGEWDGGWFVIGYVDVGEFIFFVWCSCIKIVVFKFWKRFVIWYLFDVIVDWFRFVIGFCKIVIERVFIWCNFRWLVIKRVMKCNFLVLLCIFVNVGLFSCRVCFYEGGDNSMVMVLFVFWKVKFWKVVWEFRWDVCGWSIMVVVLLVVRMEWVLVLVIEVLM